MGGMTKVPVYHFPNLYEKQGAIFVESVLYVKTM